jgi:predicted RecB family nuclease
MQQTNASAKILSWTLTTSKDEQNTAFIQISQKVAVEYPEIFLKFLEDFQKKSGKFSEDLTHNAKDLETILNLGIIR